MPVSSLASGRRGSVADAARHLYHAAQDAADGAEHSAEGLRAAARHTETLAVETVATDRRAVGV